MIKKILAYRTKKLITNILQQLTGRKNQINHATSAYWTSGIRKLPDDREMHFIRKVHGYIKLQRQQKKKKKKVVYIGVTKAIIAGPSSYKKKLQKDLFLFSLSLILDPFSLKLMMINLSLIWCSLLYLSRWSFQVVSYYCEDIIGINVGNKK